MFRNFSCLPNEVLTLIAEHLAVNDLAAFIRVSRQLHSLEIRRLLRLALTFQPRDRDSVFEWACENGRLPLVKTLVDLGVSRYLGTLGFDWSFEAAARNGQTEVMKFLLLESDAPEHLAGRLPGPPHTVDGIPPLHYSILRLLLWCEDDAYKLYDAFCEDGDGMLSGIIDPLGDEMPSLHVPTPLHIAAKWRNGRMVEELLGHPYYDCWPEMELFDIFMRTPLHFAASANASLVVERFLQRNSDLESPDWSGETPLHHAAARGHVNICKLLLDAGADSFIADYNGLTPWHHAEKNAHRQVIELLREKTGGNVPPSQPPLPYKAGEGFYPSALCQFLVDGGLDPGFFSEGDSPLRIAVNVRNTAAVQLLLDAGADINHPDDEFGDTVLHSACADGDCDMVILLLDHGADLSAVNGEECMPLHVAADHGHVAVVRMLLNAGADMSACDSLDRTPLHYAAAWGHDLVVEALLEAGSTVHARDSFGCSPLLKAAEYGHPAIVRRLIAAGANVSAADNHGRTPLHVASSAGHREIVQLLLDKGADAHARDDDGVIALHHAGAAGTDPYPKSDQDTSSFQASSEGRKAATRPLPRNNNEVTTMEPALRTANQALRGLPRDRSVLKKVHPER
jgi:ankyrin repeat protein